MEDLLILLGSFCPCNDTCQLEDLHLKKKKTILAISHMSMILPCSKRLHQSH